MFDNQGERWNTDQSAAGPGDLDYADNPSALFKGYRVADKRQDGRIK